MGEGRVEGTLRAPLTRSAISWSIFDAGRNCYGVLITVSVFTPYVATVLAPNPVRGQQLVAEIGLWSGIAGALLATLLGGGIDRMGQRKPALATLVSLLATACVSLWWAAPHGALNLAAVVTLLTISTVLFGLVEVVHNAMLLSAAKPDELGRASGLGATLGFVAASLVAVGFLWAMILPGQISADWLPPKPIFGLNAAAGEPQRIAGPIVAAALTLSVLPLLMFARDARPTGIRPADALRHALQDARELAQHFRRHPEVQRFLLARIMYNIGHAGNIMFLAIYSAGAFGWGPAQLLIEGLMTSIAAVAGGLASSWLDSRIGTKRALLLCLAANGVAFAGMIGVSHNQIFFILSYDPLRDGRPWHGPLYTTWPEWVFAICDNVNALFLVAAIALGRTMMAKLSPPEHASPLFGLFSLSAAATAWIAPVLVGAGTALFASQQAGLVPLLGMIALGCGFLCLVNLPQPAAGSMVVDNP